MNSKEIARQCRAYVVRRFLMKLAVVALALSWLAFPHATPWLQISAGLGTASQWAKNSIVSVLGGVTGKDGGSSAADKIRAVNGFPAAEVRCLAQAIYFEAGREKREAQIGVGQIALNRAASAKSPRSICRVIYTGLNTPSGCLFEQSCRYIGSAPRSGSDYDKAVELAMEIAANQARVEKLTTATHFRSTRTAAPAWTRALHRLAAHGNLEFYGPQPLEETETIGAAAATAASARVESPRQARTAAQPRRSASSTPSSSSVSNSQDDGAASRRILGVD